MIKRLLPLLLLASCAQAPQISTEISGITEYGRHEPNFRKNKTVDLPLGDKVIPKETYYDCSARMGQKTYRAMCYAGRNNFKMLEVYLYDFKGKAVDQHMTVTLHQRIMHPNEYKNPEDMDAQIRREADGNS